MIFSETAIRRLRRGVAQAGEVCPVGGPLDGVSRLIGRVVYPLQIDLRAGDRRCCQVAGSGGQNIIHRIGVEDSSRSIAE